MKKIMFNDKYGLTQAVLEGRKTMTRRIMPYPIEIDWNRRGRVTLPISGLRHGLLYMDCREILHESKPYDNIAPHKYQPTYEIGEVVAVAQRYQDIPMDYLLKHRTADGTSDWIFERLVRHSHGWTNKQGVIASLMPNRIKITNIKMERLQDITDEDCLREGIRKFYVDPVCNGYTFDGWTNNKKDVWCHSPQNAFHALIDKVGKTGTWADNPWVYVYDFELIETR